MKYALFIAITIGVFAYGAEMNAQTLGLNVVPASQRTDGWEKVAITYSAPEDAPVQLYEAVLPAATQAQCLAATDFSGAVPIPAARMQQLWGEGKKVVIVFAKSSSYGACSVILGRGSVVLSDFNVIRANFGRTYFAGSEDDKAPESQDGAQPGAGPVFSLTRHFDAN